MAMTTVSGGKSVVLTWGSGEDGQLGMGNNDEKDWACEIKSLHSKQVTVVVAGSRNSLAICDDGNLFTWGWNQRSTLGHPPQTKTESVPSPVKELSGVKNKIVQAAIGGWHCLAVDDQGCAYAWGGNEYGQCGEEPERKNEGVLRRDIVIPRRCVPHLSVCQVAAGGTHSVVLTTDGHIWTWGQPWPPGDIKQISTPVKVQGLERVCLISAGAFHNLALEEDGLLWAWGNNEYGQLGTGDTQPRSHPIRVQGLLGLTLVDIAAGGWHSNALTQKGEVYAWGRGEHGRLGFGDDKSSKMVPQKVQLLQGENVIQVSCGGTHSVALTRDGRIFSYGRGDHGRLGYAPNLVFKLTSKVQYKSVLKAYSTVLLKAESMSDKSEWVNKLKNVIQPSKGAPLKGASSEVGHSIRQSHSDGSLDTMARRPADPEEELRWMSQEVRGYVEAVLNSLAANVPKAVVLCQVEKAKEDMLNQLYSSISSQSTGRIEELLQEGQNVKQKRERFQRQSSILSKLTRQLSIHDNRSAASSWSNDGPSPDDSPRTSTPKVGGDDWRSAFDAAANGISGFTQNGDVNSGSRRTPNRMPPPPPPRG